LYKDVPVFPRLSAPEWDEVFARQNFPLEDNDFSAVPAGSETQPGNDVKLNEKKYFFSVQHRIVGKDSLKLRGFLHLWLGERNRSTYKMHYTL